MKHNVMKRSAGPIHRPRRQQLQVVTNSALKLAALLGDATATPAESNGGGAAGQGRGGQVKPRQMASTSRLIPPVANLKRSPDSWKLLAGRPSTVISPVGRSTDDYLIPKSRLISLEVVGRSVP